MNTIRVEKNKNYTVISNTVLKDDRLSLKAKGLMCIILSLPESWDFTVNGLCSLVKESKNTIYTIIKELETCGYVVKQRITDEKGRFTKHEYVFYESPLPKNPDVDNPLTKNPDVDNPDMDFCTQLNTNTNKVLNKLSTNNNSLRKKICEKVEQAEKYTPPRVAPHPPPSKEEVIEYFAGKIPTGSDTPERFYNLMSAQNWTYKGSVIYNWRLIADNWIVKEKSTQQVINKSYERPNKDQQRYERIARHIQRYNDAVAKRAAGNSGS